jgi:hypothetical protein
MERATIYRAISAPTALVGGSLSILAAAAIYWNNEGNPWFGRVIRGQSFAQIWIAILLATVAANTFFIWREAHRTGRPFISSGMKLALRGITPCVLIPAAFTAWFLTTGYLGGAELHLVVIWIASYGLALLSTALFAPRSLALLGWAFLLSGLAVPTATNLVQDFSIHLPVFAMGMTFGLYHLIYATFTWPWPRKAGAGKAQSTFE